MSTNNISNMLNSQLRVSGLASGLDTDTLVKKLITLESTRVDKAKQNRQLTAWKQEAYRQVTSSLQSFYSTYFDILSPTNITSASAFSAFKTTFNGADTSPYVKMSANAGAMGGDYVIKDVVMAKSAKLVGTAIAGSPEQVAGDTTKLLSDIKDYFTPSLAPDSFDSDGDGVNDADIQFSINGKTFTFDSTKTTLSSIMNTVNNDKDAGVTMSYDELSDSISVKSKQTGSSAQIGISDKMGNLMSSLGFSGANAGAMGSDASMQLSVDGGAFQTVTRTSNIFTINNVTYTLTQNTDAGATVNASVSADASKIVDLVKGFVGKYNEILNMINTKMSEVRDTDYMPLTDEQKSAMSTSDITAWENKVKTGLLRNDSILGSLVDNMRSALYSSVSGISATLSSIGITTGAYTEKGKLTIDETKLTKAITENPDQVIQLFTKQSQYSYGDSVSDSAKRSVRKAEEGLAWKLSDILQDNLRTMKYGSNQKGALLEKAGVIGDSSEYANVLSKELTDDDTTIDNLITKLQNKEDYWYKKFTAMESAMDYMNQQSAWITQQFSQLTGG